MVHDQRRRPGRGTSWPAIVMAVAVALAALLVPSERTPSAAAAAPTIKTEVLVYGGTPSGVLAAVTASRAGADVILLEPRQHLGGMMSSGLGWTDFGARGTLRGYTGEFFDRTQAAEGLPDGRFHFQPHTAEYAFRAMLHTTDVRVRYGERIRDRGGVSKNGQRILTLTTTTGRTYAAKVFIDATYEADLMAQAGVSYAVGREGRSTYDESLAGARPTQLLLTLDDAVARPFVTPAPRSVGSADGRIQDSNYRICFSSDPANRTAFTKPAGYASHEYDVYIEYLKARSKSSGTAARLSWILGISPLPNQKYDVNDVGPLSTAVPGLNWDYPEADHATRLEIEAEHRRFTQGLLFHLRNNRRVPSSVRNELARYGLCKDEFTDNDNWPWLLYLREGRRMVGEHVLRQSDIETSQGKPDIIGISSYRVDSHYVSRWIDDDDRLLVEGLMSLAYQRYAIPYRSITPKRTEVTNLLVSVAASASHVAHSSLRMEPQYMLMGEAAGEAAALAISRPPQSPVTQAKDVQRIDVGELQRRLQAHGAYLDNPVVGAQTPLNDADRRRR